MFQACCWHLLYWPLIHLQSKLKYLNKAPVAPDIDKVVEKKEVSLFKKCVFEAVGTFILILLGCGVVACVLLEKSKGAGGGWITITLAWGLAVMCGVLVAGHTAARILIQH